MQIPEKCANNFFQGMKVERNSSHVKCRYRIIGRLISIKVLWEFFHPNTPIKRWTLDWVCNHPPGLVSSSSSSLVILTCQYVLWIKASQPITYLELQGKLPSSQSLQNHSRRDHRQVRSSRVTRQDLQSSSHNPGVTMTCWCQSSVIYPMTWGGAPSSSGQ